MHAAHWMNPNAGVAPALAAAFATAAVALVTALAPAAPAAAATVEVNYAEPDNFTDIGRTRWDRERTLKALTAYVQQLGQALPAQQTLRLDVSDIDLAGDIRPWGWNEVRVLRGQADWPTITWRYTLLEGERTLKTDEVRLSDLSYLQGLSGRDRPGDELAAEKRMLRRWFSATFAQP